MKNKYKAIVNITNTIKDRAAIFGVYFDYTYKHISCFRFLNKTIIIKTYKFKPIPTYIDCNVNIFYTDYIKELNTRYIKTKYFLKENNNLSISLFKYLFIINITKYKDYNISRVNKKLNKIVLE